MRFTEARGTKFSQWYVNMKKRADDSNIGHMAIYQLMADMLAVQTGQETVAEVLTGLTVTWDSVLDVTLAAGAAVSFDGYYLESDSWGFNATSDGSFFAVIAPEEDTITISAGGVQDRIDIIEVRPVQSGYNSVARSFKDPVTDAITSASVNTRMEYTYESQVVEGTEAGSPVAASKTAGWIKIAEIYVLASAAAIDQNDIDDYRDSLSWTTESGDTIQGVHADVEANTTHSASDGSDHSKVGANETASGLNTTHRGSAGGGDHSDVATNTTHRGSAGGGDHSDVATNNSKVSNATHTSEVTGSGALTIADNVVDEANLKLDTAPTDGKVLVAKSTAGGDLDWDDGTVLSLAADHDTDDVIYVAMILHGTDATPPAANTVPRGTLYIQYTA